MSETTNNKEMNILNELRKDSRVSLTKMSRKTGIPVSTLFERVKSNPYIRKKTCILDFERLGYSARAVIMVKAPNDKKDALLKHLLRNPNVNSAFRINSGYSFHLDVVFRTMLELEGFIEKIRDEYSIYDEQVFYLLESCKYEGMEIAV